MIKFLLICCSCCVTVFSSAQKSDSLVVTREKGFFSILYENDVFTKTDYYYTQGVRAELVLPGLNHSPVNFILPVLKTNTLQYSGIDAEQDCYTPTSLSADTIRKGDRPYSGAIYIGGFRISNDEKNHQRLTAGIDLGTVGPCALCEEEQKGIHRVLVDQQPMGWGFQIRQDALINYHLEYEKGLYLNNFFEFLVKAQAQAGTFKDNLCVGATIRFGSMHSYFKFYEPGIGKERIGGEDEKGQFFFFVQGQTSLIGYDATLEGGLFDTNNVYVINPSALERVVYSFNGGICWYYKKFRITYSQIYISPEFNGGLSHAWGSVLFQFGF